MRNLSVILLLLITACNPYVIDPEISGTVFNYSGYSGATLMVAVYEQDSNLRLVSSQNLGVIAESNQAIYTLTVSNYSPQNKYTIRAFLDKDGDLLLDHNENINQQKDLQGFSSLNINLSLFPVLFGTVIDDSVAIAYDFSIDLYIDDVLNNTGTATLTDQDNSNYTVYFTDSFDYNPAYTVKAFYDINLNGTWNVTNKEPVGASTKTITAGNTEIPVADIIISDSNDAPPAVTLLFPTNGSFDQVLTGLDLYWSSVIDPDGDTVYYDVYLSTSPLQTLVVSGLTSTNYTLSNLAANVTYYWHIKVHDAYLGLTPSATFTFQTRP